MAERKPGPVKPPVIDLKARPQEGKAETETGETAAEPARPTPPPRPSARLAMPWSAIAIAAAAGALLGTGLTYGLVNLVPMPDRRPLPLDPAPRLEALETALAETSGRIGSGEEQARRTQVSLDATIAQLDAGLTELRAAIAALPAPAATDLAPLEAQLAALEDRVAAIGAGASNADAASMAETLSGIETERTQVQARLDQHDGRLGGLDTALVALRDELAAARAEFSVQSSPVGSVPLGPAVKLPLLVSGLESALANGRAYAGELDALSALLPDLAVPEAVRTAAATGLPRPDAVAARFTALVPEILGGRAAVASGDLGQDALEWLKGVLALRPTGEIEGTTPEAVISRLEPAVARGDFIAAAALLDGLPQPMQAASGEVGGQIRSLGAAQTFIADLRATALAPLAEAGQ
jgi:hypothetical protein